MVQLKAFGSQAYQISVEGDINLRESDQVEIRFRLNDPENQVLGAIRSAPQLAPVRRDDLWKTTCFECFFKRPNESAYWELNFSSKSEWNLYRFTNYRDPTPPQRSDEWKVLELVKGDQEIICRLQASIKVLELQASLCAVIQTKDDTFYYSTLHSGEKPDFHLQESLKLTRKAP